MSDYIPELLNELTRIVVTTRNDNPSVQEYDALVPQEWKACQDICSAVSQKQNGIPTLEQMRAVYGSVIRMLRTKHVPVDQIRARLDEAFTRSQGGRYQFDEHEIELGLSDVLRA